MLSSGVIRTYHKKDCNHEFCRCDEKNGFQLKLEYFHNNGVIEGIYKKYYRNGKLQEERNYLNNEIINYKNYDKNDNLCNDRILINLMNLY